MKIKIETCECSCFLAQTTRYGEWNVQNYLDKFKAIVAFKNALSSQTYWVIHLNNKHINNVIIDGISLRKLL